MAKQKIKKSSGNALQSSLTENIILHILFIAMTVVFLYPVLLVIGVSFTETGSLLLEGYKMIPKKLSFDAYRVAISSADILIAYKNTILATVIGTVLGVFVTLLYSYAISRKDFRHRKFFTFYAYFTTLFGGGMVPWYIVCTQILNIDNTFWALFLPSLFSVWNMIVLRTFITANIPDALIEAARIDGCSQFGIFFRMVIPLSVAGTATIALFMALSFWNDYYLPMMLVTDEKLYNLQYYLQIIFLNIEELSKNSALAASGAAVNVPTETTRFAMCVLTMGPILIVYPFFQKYFVKGLTVGSVKG